MEYRGGEYIKRLRILGGFNTQKEFAKEIGVSRGFVNHIENGRRKLPLSTFIELAEKFGIKPGDIFKEKKKWK